MTLYHYSKEDQIKLIKKHADLDNTDADHIVQITWKLTFADLKKLAKAIRIISRGVKS